MVCIFQVARNRGADFYKLIIITRLLTDLITSLITTTLFQLFIFTWRQNPNFSYLILMIQKNTYRLPHISL